MYKELKLMQSIHICSQNCLFSRTQLHPLLKIGINFQVPLPPPAFRPELGLQRYQGPLATDHEYIRNRQNAGMNKICIKKSNCAPIHL